MLSRPRRTRPLALLLALGLVAGACGGDGDDAAAPGTDASTEDAGEPVHGGRLVYGIEADTANAWPGYRASYATSGYMVIQSVSDPLFLPNADGESVPHLLESAEPNEDFTQWTLTIREGITFHDGTPLDAEAVKFNMETCVGSGLAGPTYANIGAIEAEGQVVTVTTATSPWVALPASFAGNHGCAFMLSREWLQSLPDIPHRTEGSPFYDAELAATPADGNPAEPV